MITTVKRCVGAAILVGAFASVPVAQAAPDPYFPSPPLWCPGNDPNAFVASGYGGFCEGRSYPDGSRWNAYRVGFFWQPLRCIVFDGSAFPPVAPPGACGGDWGG